ncbi:MAG: cytochrome c [Magnetococcales bacterium]|nr:cytochrome c [Magnetococcales bacterium]
MKYRLPILAAGLCLPALLASAATGEVTPVRQKALSELLRHDCGSCHGLTRKGGLGPPLTAEALAGKSDELLADTIRLGRPGAAMPPWDGLLTQEEILWLVAALRRGFREGQP